jgi:hypothetical protein
MNQNRRITAQSLIEFALLLPLLFILIMGLFDVGRAIFFFSVLNTAAREGTRFAIVQPGCDYYVDPLACTGGELDSYPLDCNVAASVANINICNEIKDYYFHINELSGSTVTIEHPEYSLADPDLPPDIAVSITIDHQFVPLTPGLGLIANFPISVNSEMLLTPLSRP